MSMRRRRRLIFGGALVSAMALGLLQPSTTRAQPAPPARSGTIVSGVLTTSTAVACQSLPDCLPWLESGCNPALAGREPAWLSAIVDVRALADGTTPRTLVIRRASPDGFILGGALIQFWRADCTEIRRASWHTVWDCPVGPRTRHLWRYECEELRGRWEDASLGLLQGPRLLQARLRLPVPAGAAWMTIGANDNVNLLWTLR